MSADTLETRKTRRAAASSPVDLSGPDRRVGPRRGPLRPQQLTPSRARIHGRALLLTFRAVDSLLLGGYALACIFALPSLSWGVGLSIAAFCVVSMWAIGSLHGYSFRADEPFLRHLGRLAGAFALTAVAVCVPMLVAGERLSSLPLIWLAGGALSVLVWHGFAWNLVRRARAQGRLAANIVIVGAGPNAERLIKAALKVGDVAILGVFDDRGARAPKTIHGVPVLGDTEALLGHKIMPYVDKVVVTVPEASQARVKEIIDRLSVLPNAIALFISEGETDRPEAVARIAGTPLAYVSGKPNDIVRAIIKRVQDLAIGSVALVLTSPIMAVVALAIRLDSPGPVLFRQRRHGFNNEVIVVWKFRSMRVEASDAHATRQVSADDDRVTRVGRFIRATSLDELPQIFNVLLGEMSLVGPRPHAIGMMTGEVESERLVAHYAHRHRIKPGMTGWAAINGSRGPVNTPESVRERVALDVAYIERQSFWLDLYIIAMTIPCLLGDQQTVR